MAYAPTTDPLCFLSVQISEERRAYALTVDPLRFLSVKISGGRTVNVPVYPNIEKQDSLPFRSPGEFALCEGKSCPGKLIVMYKKGLKVRKEYIQEGDSKAFTFRSECFRGPGSPPGEVTLRTFKSLDELISDCMKHAIFTEPLEAVTAPHLLLVRISELSTVNVPVYASRQSSGYLTAQDEGVYALRKGTTNSDRLILMYKKGPEVKEVCIQNSPDEPFVFTTFDSVKHTFESLGGLIGACMGWRILTEPLVTRVHGAELLAAAFASSAFASSALGGGASSSAPPGLTM